MTSPVALLGDRSGELGFRFPYSCMMKLRGEVRPSPCHTTFGKLPGTHSRTCTRSYGSVSK